MVSFSFSYQNNCFYFHLPFTCVTFTKRESTILFFFYLLLSYHVHCRKFPEIKNSSLLSLFSFNLSKFLSPFFLSISFYLNMSPYFLFLSLSNSLLRFLIYFLILFVFSLELFSILIRFTFSFLSLSTLMSFSFHWFSYLSLFLFTILSAYLNSVIFYSSCLFLSVLSIWAALKWN